MIGRCREVAGVVVESYQAGTTMVNRLMLINI
jgi:hypothetical protein